MADTLGPWQGTYSPGYSINIYQGGDPSKPLTSVNLRSVTRIATSKSLDDVSGTFQITLKDRSAQAKVQPMDVVTIRLKGHNQGWGKVFVGVVDGPDPAGNADPAASEADVTITGRCTGKYLQINSMFLPVWDPKANLPTALIFGKGDATNKLGTTVNAYTPRAIFGYIFDHFVVGQRNMVGESGTPNARFWMSRKNRFEYVKNGDGKIFQVPFIQFDEDTCDTALTELVVQGFTEGWVDEVGNIVYRRPAWDAPVSWNLHTGGLRNWDLPGTDTGMATYVEVYPGALPALPSGVAQAMMAGRAPIPSDYVTGLQGSGFKSIASREFIIDTDKTGKVTSNGARNWYYRKQRQYGIRPYMITSPLLASREQAQGQAEGLLRFMLRLDKSGTITIPGEPNVRMGQTIYLTGPLDDQVITRTYYIEGIAHEYVEGDHYDTTLTLTHGRDPGDPNWQQMVLPNFSASQLAEASGILSPPSKTTPSQSPTGSGGNLPADANGYVNPLGLIKNLTPERIDQGVDYAGSGTIVSPCNGTVAYAGGPGVGWPGQTASDDTGCWVSITFGDGPYKGFQCYFAEHIKPLVTTGQTVKAGDPIAILYDGGANLECGWAAGVGTETLARKLGQTSGGSAMGASWNAFLVATGCPSGTGNNLGGPFGQVPAGYPAPHWPS